MTPPITVLIVDDQSLMRMGFAMVLKAEDDIAVVGEAADGPAALDQVAALRPDIVLMDVRMPGFDGIEATRRVVQSSPDTRVIVLTTFDLDEYAIGAINAGASGFLLKDVRPHDLVAAIRAVANGDATISPRVTRRMLDLFAGHLPMAAAPAEMAADPLAVLTPRERDVFDGVVAGQSNAEIGRALTVSETTVKTHVAGILTKLGLRDRLQTVVWAYQNGLVKPTTSA
ncbi:MAG: response regulator transcription factor [Propionibacteriaceae bacterium]|jgi:DNA-binding NarL/FixJ family response regulator|nr:response regulator transcription factor [Propionibacteriaceae bacterium]